MVWSYSVCLHVHDEIKMTNYTNYSFKMKVDIQMMRMGKSIRHIWFNAYEDTGHISHLLRLCPGDIRSKVQQTPG